MSKPKYRIPFKRGSDGVLDMMEYTTADDGDTREPDAPYDYFDQRPDEWREPVEFDATLDIGHSSRGRSAARIHVTNADNRETYSLGLSGFVEAVKKFGARKGQIRGRWTFRKQGANYAVHPVTK